MSVGVDCAQGVGGGVALLARVMGLAEETIRQGLAAVEGDERSEGDGEASWWWAPAGR